jgi:hypothetical protein
MKNVAKLVILAVTVCLVGCIGPKPVKQGNDQYGCPIPPPAVFTKAGVDLNFAQSTFKNLVIGTIDIKTHPEVVTIASQASLDGQISEYIRCLALRRDGYSPEQALYLQDMFNFMATKPTADQYLQWKRENKFPSINSPASEPKLEISGLIVSQAKQTNGPAVLVSDVAADIDMRVHNKGTASITINKVILSLIQFQEKDISGPLGGNSVLSSTATYNADLSQFNKPGQTIEIPVAHIVEKDAADRFDIIATATKRFNTLDNRISTWTVQSLLETSHGMITGKIFSVSIPVPMTR